MNLQDRIEGHNLRNRKLVQVFKSRNVSLDEARSIELHFWADRQSNAVRLGHELYKKGFVILVLKPEDTIEDAGRWNIEAGVKATISSVISESFTKDLVNLAAEAGGEYDGWGTSV